MQQVSTFSQLQSAVKLVPLDNQEGRLWVGVQDVASRDQELDFINWFLGVTDEMAHHEPILVMVRVQGEHRSMATHYVDEEAEELLHSFTWDEIHRPFLH